VTTSSAIPCTLSPRNCVWFHSTTRRQVRFFPQKSLRNFHQKLGEISSCERTAYGLAHRHVHGTAEKSRNVSNPARKTVEKIPQKAATLHGSTKKHLFIDINNFTSLCFSYLLPLHQWLSLPTQRPSRSLLARRSSFAWCDLINDRQHRFPLFENGQAGPTKLERKRLFVRYKQPTRSRLAIASHRVNTCDRRPLKFQTGN
jgi:hypothetical protein